MIILEKDKVYKIKHNIINTINWRNYVIFSPLSNMTIPEDFLEGNLNNYPMSLTIYTHFTVRFDGSISTKYDVGHNGVPCPSATGLNCCCSILDINPNDYNDIRNAINKLGDGYMYNRKLNKIVIK